MAGGTWNGVQNKVRPGVYIRFTSSRGLGLVVGERGIVTIPEALSWGPVGVVQTVEAGDDMRPYCGYDITAPQARFLNEIFKGTNRTSAPYRVYLYRLAATSSAEATATSGALTATAKYPGVRGNDITIVITEDVDNEGSFTVSTVVDNEIMDEQTAETVADLVANDWVTWSGTGALTATVGAPLTGGADGTVQSSAYPDYLEAIEPYKFDIMIYDGTDTTVQDAMIAFVKRMCDDNGQSGATLNDGTVLTAAQTCWWAGGAEAGAKYNESLTYAQYPGAIACSPVMKNSQYIEALTSGELVLYAEDGKVRIEQDINSLVTLTQDITKPYQKNRVIRLCNTIANDVYRQFTDSYIGVVNNNDEGRMMFKNAIVGYLLDIQANNGIQNFEPEDVEVLPGTDIDAIVVNIAIRAVDSIEKIYLTIEVN